MHLLASSQRVIVPATDGAAGIATQAGAVAGMGVGAIGGTVAMSVGSQGGPGGDTPSGERPSPHAVRRSDRYTDPDTIAEVLGPGHIERHGDPGTWKYLGKKQVPTTEPGRLEGSKKVYEVFLDENGEQIEWHYWISRDGTIDGGKVVFPGTTRRDGLAN